MNQGNPPPYPGQEPTPIQVNVIQVQPVAGLYLGTKPALVVCQVCRQQVMTTMEMRPTVRAHLWACFLFLVGFWPCMCIPYCTPRCMNIDHYCPNCRAYIGKYD